MAKKAEMQMLTIRIPKDLHRKLKREADRKGQTLNAEIISMLTEQDRALAVAEDALTTARNALAQTRRFDDLESSLRQAYELAEEFRKRQLNEPVATSPSGDDHGQRDETRRE